MIIIMHESTKIVLKDRLKWLEKSISLQVGFLPFPSRHKAAEQGYLFPTAVVPMWLQVIIQLIIIELASAIKYGAV